MDLSRLPNAVKDFEKLITEGRIYVDKTDLLSTLLLSTIASLSFYQDLAGLGRAFLFQPLSIYLNKD